MEHQTETRLETIVLNLVQQIVETFEKQSDRRYLSVQEWCLLENTAVVINDIYLKPESNLKSEHVETALNYFQRIERIIKVDHDKKEKDYRDRHRYLIKEARQRTLIPEEIQELNELSIALTDGFY